LEAYLRRYEIVALQEAEEEAHLEWSLLID
jgi:hypothetical protein